VQDVRITDTSDLWWKNAVLYCVDVKTFFDADGDGVGDFAGLAERIDYLAQLGITCLWLMPFYPTPGRDGGYDVMDFYGVDDRLGSLGDLVEVIRTANDRGIRVIADLVVNHTSDRHPWFRSARRSPNSPFRDFYVWRTDPPPDTQGQVVFPGEEDGIWSWDDSAQAWYLHHFYSHQPDLNFANPRVRNEVAKVMGFWLQLGLDGFRVDAVPFLVQDKETTDPTTGVPSDPHQYLRELRAFLGRRRGGAVLVGEVNVPHREQAKYFGGDRGDELNMMFDFIGMESLYLSLARSDARPLARALRRRPEVNADTQWVTFVRNHDELTLDKLTQKQREEVFASFGPEPHMQVYGRGLRRRLPPMLGGDPRRLRMVYSLLFAIPGTPCLFYGEEIGMGENPDADGRTAVRTPMQWTSGPGGGFSTAPPRRLIQPVVQGGYAPEHINVEDQQSDPGSLWRFVARLIAAYRRLPELGWGKAEFLEVDRRVLAHCSTWGERSVVAVHGFCDEPMVVDVPLDRGSELVDVFSGERIPVQRGNASVKLDAYGHRWFRMVN
jgi:trehalose synthase